MPIQTQQYSILEAACGVQVSFDKLFSNPQKIANITSANRSNGVSSIRLTGVSEVVRVGDKIVIGQGESTTFTSNPISDSYLGSFVVTSVDSTGTTITFNQNLPNDASLAAVNGILYKQSNITAAENYTVEFTIETKVPDTATVSLRPSTYVTNGYEGFTPITIVELVSKFSTSAKVLLKMIIRDTKSNAILKTEYKELIVSDSSKKPCEIISSKPIDISFYELNNSNNWSYFHQGYLLAQFIPNMEYKNITIKLIKKNNQLLPSRGGNNKVRIIADPIKLQNKQTTIDKIRSAILKQYDTINSSIAIANLGNKSYDIIVEDKLIKPEDFNDIVIDIVPPETGVSIKFSDVAKAIPYSQDTYSVPKISLLRWNDSNNIRFIGELHYNEQIYDKDMILLNISGSTNLSGTITDITNGINYLVTN